MVCLKMGKIVCDDGFVISRRMKLDRLVKKKQAEIINTEVINGYTHICMRNANVNDGIYDLLLCFNPRKRIEYIGVIPMGRHHQFFRITRGKYVMNDGAYLWLHREEVEEDTRRWLNQYQGEDRKKYFWGQAGMVVDLDRGSRIFAFMDFKPTLLARLKK